MRFLLALLVVLQACASAPKETPDAQADLKRRLRDVEDAIGAQEPAEGRQAMLRCAADVEIALGEQDRALALLERIEPEAQRAREVMSLMREGGSGEGLRQALLALLERRGPRTSEFMPVAYASCGRENEVIRLVLATRAPSWMVHQACDEYIARGRVDASIVLLRVAVKVSADDGVVLRVVDLLGARGYFREAIGVIRELVQKPESRDDGLVRVLEQARCVPSVVEHTGLVEEIVDHERRTRALECLAVGFAKAGRNEEALRCVDEGERLLEGVKHKVARGEYVWLACKLAEARTMAGGREKAQQVLRDLEGFIARMPDAPPGKREDGMVPDEETQKETALMAFSAARLECGLDTSFAYIDRMPRFVRTWVLADLADRRWDSGDQAGALDAMGRLPDGYDRAALLVRFSRGSFDRARSVSMLREALRILDEINEAEPNPEGGFCYEVGLPDKFSDTLLALGAFEPGEALRFATERKDALGELLYARAMIAIARQHRGSLAEHVAAGDRLLVELGRLAGEAGR